MNKRTLTRRRSAVGKALRTHTATLTLAAIIFWTALAGWNVFLAAVNALAGRCWLTALGVAGALGGLDMVRRALRVRRAEAGRKADPLGSVGERRTFLADPTDPNVAVLANGRLGHAVRVGPRQEDGVPVDLASVHEEWPIVGYWETDPGPDQRRGDHA